MGDTALLLSGPAKVYIEESAVDVEVGFITKGGVTLDVTSQTMDLYADELGTTPANTVITGVSAMVKFAFAEFSLVNLKRALLNGVTLQDDVTSTKKRIEIRPLAGKLLSSRASKWTIKPIDPTTGAETTNKDLWITIPKGVPSAETVSLAFATETQREIAVSLICQPDTSANKYRLLYYGDGTAVDANESGF